MTAAQETDVAAPRIVRMMPFRFRFAPFRVDPFSFQSAGVDPREPRFVRVTRPFFQVRRPRPVVIQVDPAQVVESATKAADVLMRRWAPFQPRRARAPFDADWNFEALRPRPIQQQSRESMFDDFKASWIKALKQAQTQPQEGQQQEQGEGKSQSYSYSINVKSHMGKEQRDGKDVPVLEGDIEEVTKKNDGPAKRTTKHFKKAFQF
eukprot:TRINITY_DN2297_c0_g2_i4.p1 TRINITY_DN2297_c0_g2~~TRINITY_DN2297_c0_g2_i4.p1  ORF type:complete len:207 (+),score=77.61 TRINITY_DN2297_c0_g2_i4:63-683(+)